MARPINAIGPPDGVVTHCTQGATGVGLALGGALGEAFGDARALGPALTVGVGELDATSGPCAVHAHARHAPAATKPSLFIDRLTSRPQRPLRAADLHAERISPPHSWGGGWRSQTEGL